jgi:hypothetical protein
LAEEIRKEFPELEDFVDEVIENTGGTKEHGQIKQEDKDHIVID